MGPQGLSKEHGITNFLLSHKFKTFIIAAVTIVAIYHVKLSIGDSWWKSHVSDIKLKEKLGKMSSPKAGDDVGQIKWAHAVNSLALLDEALKSDVQFLEADVQVNSSGVLIMAHPPNNTSDLTLKYFLEEVIKHNKGAKLDFKSQEAATEGIKYVGKMKPEVRKTIWMNADILTGTKAPATKLNADQFLALVKNHTPESMLSLGWTLSMPKGQYKGGFDKEMVQAMHNTLVKNQVAQPVTFAVEVTYTLLSLGEISWLLSKTDKSSLTIWFTKQSKANLDNILCLREEFGKDKVYLDLPAPLREEFDAYLSGSKSATASCKVKLN